MTRLTDLPIFEQIYDTDDITPSQIKVWKWAARHLDVVRFFPLPAMKGVGGTDPSYVSRLLATLVTDGWLEREGDGRQAKYRVPLSRLRKQDGATDAADIDAEPSLESADDADEDMEKADLTALLAARIRAKRAPIHSPGVF